MKIHNLRLSIEYLNFGEKFNLILKRINRVPINKLGAFVESEGVTVMDLKKMLPFTLGNYHYY